MGLGSCISLRSVVYWRLPFFRTARARNAFLIVLNEVRGRYWFVIVGYVVIPEHVHLLIGESRKANPSVVMQVLKQRVSRRLRGSVRGKSSERQLLLWRDVDVYRSFWQRRFYDFNVWSRKKRIEKLNYMHMNPVKRGLVADAKLWAWSSYRFYQYGEQSLCTPDGLKD
jgi:putative transposase